MSPFHPLRRLGSIGLAAALLVPAASCSRKGGGNPAAPPAGTAVVAGLVYSLSGGGSPVSGATVTSAPSAGADANTNALGQFQLTIPAGSGVAITAVKSGFSPHPAWFSLANGNLRTTTLSLLPIGGGAILVVSAGGKVTDAFGKVAITLPGGFVTGISNALVSLTGLNPASVQSLGLPGTHAGVSTAGTSVFLQPIEAADLDVSDGAGTEYALAKPASLELPIPTLFQALPALATGMSVPCFRYDEASGKWKQFGSGTVGTSSVTSGPAVIVSVPAGTGGWLAAALTSTGTASVQGVVTSGGLPVEGADVQAFPGGIARTDASGAYVVGAPPGSPTQIVATRLAMGTVTPGSVSLTTGALGSTTLASQIVVQSGGSTLTYTIRAQLTRGRDAFGVLRDAAIVRVIANTTPSPTLVDGAVVQFRHAATWDPLPALNPAIYGAGTYGIIGGLANGSLTLARGSTYSLRVDLDADGTFDATGSVTMPGQPAIVSPSQGAVMDSAFACTWTDDQSALAGYAASYVASFEPNIGPAPALFVEDFPTLTHFVGNGVPDPVHHMPNDPLLSGTYTCRLWAFNGPIQYLLPDTTLFNAPNVAGANVSGWFSAVAQADSVVFSTTGVIGPRPSATRRDRGSTALAGRTR